MVGRAITVSRFQQLFVLAYQQNQKTTGQMAQYAWNILAAQGQRLIKEGKTLETPEDNLAELTAQAGVFQEKLLPVLKARHMI